MGLTIVKSSRIEMILSGGNMRRGLYCVSCTEDVYALLILLPSLRTLLMKVYKSCVREERETRLTTGPAEALFSPVVLKPRHVGIGVGSIYRF